MSPSSPPHEPHLPCSWQVLHGALASARPDEAALSTDDWQGLVAASGGAGQLLDAMDGIVAAALRKVVASV